MSHHVGLKGQSWKEVMESFHVESSSFIQKLKTFNISNARQLVSMYCSHVESLGNFKNKYKTKKEKVRNQTTYISSAKKKRGRRTKKKKKKKKEEEEEEAVASWRHPCFVVVFFLFSFFSVFFPYKWNFSCFGPISIYRPKRPDFIGTAVTQPVFFPVQKKGVICTDALASTVYTSCTGRYGTELTSLVTTAR